MACSLIPLRSPDAGAVDLGFIVPLHALLCLRRCAGPMQFRVRMFLFSLTTRQRCLPVEPMPFSRAWLVWSEIVILLIGVCPSFMGAGCSLALKTNPLSLERA